MTHPRKADILRTGSTDVSVSREEKTEHRRFQLESCHKPANSADVVSTQLLLIRANLADDIWVFEPEWSHRMFASERST